MRDLAREYHPLSKQVMEELYNSTSTKEGKGIDDKQEDNISSATAAGKGTAKVKKRYVPPPHL